MSRILISYRREDSADVTGRIHDRLIKVFPKAVFRDVDNIPYGADFRIILEQQVSKCDVFLAVIGPGWMEAKNSEGQVRLEDPKDFVRIEIESALKRQIPVIPVLVRGAKIPAAERLPASIQDLSYRHGIEVRPDPDFHRDMDRLIEALKQNIAALVDQRTEPSEGVEAAVEDLTKPPSPVPGPKEKPKRVPEEKPSPQPVRAKKQTARQSSARSAEKPRQETPFEMVKVPKGPFLYGYEKTREVIDYDYWIDQYPVTNKKYAAFIAAGGYANQQYWSEEGWKWKTDKNLSVPKSWDDAESKRTDHPVVGVSYYEAEAYAKWAGKRLPTEREWEKAARGTDGRLYPWGDQFDESACNSYKSFWGGYWKAVTDTVTGNIRTTTVTSYPNGVSPFGCYDMAGNVHEWCADWYDEMKGARVRRGGSWGCLPGGVRSVDRDGSSPTDRDDDVGFRCAQDIP